MESIHKRLDIKKSASEEALSVHQLVTYLMITFFVNI